MTLVDERIREKSVGLRETSPLHHLRHLRITSKANAKPPPYSHSMVAGGLLEMSKQTRLAPLTSLMMRLDIFSST